MDMRCVGIDPGSKSFDFYGTDDNTILIDHSLPSEEVAANPHLLMEVIEPLQPLDIIVGPSGYGTPLTSLEAAAESVLTEILPSDSGDVRVNEGIRNVFYLMKERRWPVYLTPGVIHLPTVPEYRKANRLDMGTADKVCVAFLSIWDQASFLNIPIEETSFVLVEIGFGFTAVLGIDKGRIVDGIGGTSGGPGFLCPGAMDAELAIRFGRKPQQILFTGGIRDLAGGDQTLTLEEMIADSDRFGEPLELFWESIERSCVAMMVSVRAPREILLSGRLARFPGVIEILTTRLARHAPVRLVGRCAVVAKEAAEGAAMVGEGLLGGRFQPLVERMRLREASGSMYDHILISGLRDEVRA
jgi:predicted butyrate kinase (DUF1464 family)